MLKYLLMLTAVVYCEVLTLTSDNLYETLDNQLQEFDKPEKNQKGLLLTFVSRGEGTLQY